MVALPDLPVQQRKVGRAIELEWAPVGLCLRGGPPRSRNRSSAADQKGMCR